MPEEVQERRGEFVRRLFGLVMPGVDGAAAQLAGRPRPPDRLGVAGGGARGSVRSHTRG